MRIILALLFAFLAVLPCYAQATVRLTTQDTKFVNGTNPLPVTAVSGATPADVNVKQVVGATPSAANGLSVRLTNGTTYNGATAPLATQLSIGNVAVDATHTVPVGISIGNTAVSASAPVPVSATGAANTATNPLYTGPSSVAQASQIQGNASIAASDTAIAFGASFTQFDVSTTSGASNIYIDFANGTATTGDFGPCAGGFAYHYSGAPVTGFHYIGSGTTGTIFWTAR